MDSRQDFFQNVCCLYFEAGGVDTGMAAEIFVLQQLGLPRTVSYTE